MTEQELQQLVQQVVTQLPQGNSISLQQANQLSAAIQGKASQMGLAAVVAVSNTAAHPVSVQCMPGSLLAAYDIAFCKAYTVVALKMPTTKLKQLAQPGAELYGIQFTNQGKIVIFGGGEPLYNSKGELIGGLGVSGGTEGQDTVLAEFGAEWCKANL